MFRAWRRHLPRACRACSATPILLAAAAAPRPVPFSRLTLTAQLEVLEHPARESWNLCAPLNPFLTVWKQRAIQGRLRVTPWPRGAARWLSGRAYAARFLRALGGRARVAPQPGAGVAAQRDFIRAKLEARYLYPLLWSRDS